MIICQWKTSNTLTYKYDLSPPILISSHISLVQIGAVLEEKTTDTWTVCKFNVLQQSGVLAIMRSITRWCLWKRCYHEIFFILKTNDVFANIIHLSYSFDNKLDLLLGLSCVWLFGLRKCAIYVRWELQVNVMKRSCIWHYLAIAIAFWECCSRYPFGFQWKITFLPDLISSRLVAVAISSKPSIWMMSWLETTRTKSLRDCFWPILVDLISLKTAKNHYMVSFVIDAVVM